MFGVSSFFHRKNELTPKALNPATREEIMVPLIELYTVAFWKTFLQGDHRYLAPGYAKRHRLEAIVKIIEE
jgi:hypothetical protein